MDTYNRLLRIERQRFSVFSGMYVALRRTPEDHPAYRQLKAACRTAEQYWREARDILNACRLQWGDSVPAEPLPWLVEADDLVLAQPVSSLDVSPLAPVPVESQFSPAEQVEPVAT